MRVVRRSAVASLAVLVMAAACGGGGDATPDGATPDGATPRDGGATPQDGGAPGSDAGFPPGATNPARLWLAPINGSEINLQLAAAEPPPF